tara:strand:+ start:395 stop:604 length:210 start_codon:yes stop_codon:yes gene_type:complete
MEKPKDKNKITFARWGVRTLAISASTLAAVALIKGEFQAGGLLALGWLSIVIAEKRMFKTPASEESPTS